MTIAVLWYREKFDALWCLADTRISNGDAVVVDTGPKVLPLRVNVYKQVDDGPWGAEDTRVYGYSYAGSTLSGMSTYAMATGCCHALARNNKSARLPSLKEVADLVAACAAHCIRDGASRQSSSDVGLQKFAFVALVFGYCPRAERYRGFAIEPSISERDFAVHSRELSIEAGVYYPIGSGSEMFDKLMQKQRAPRQGVLHAFADLFSGSQSSSVGGHLQAGIAMRHGFDVCPVLHITEQRTARMSLLGMDIDTDIKLDGFRVGFNFVSLDE